MAASTRRSGVVSSRQQVVALQSAVRQEIIDTLEGLGGEAAVAAVATQLGRPADGIYYHLRRLEGAGLLREVPDGDQRRGRRYRTITGSKRRINLRYRGGSAGNAAAVAGVVASMLRMARRDFDRALRSGQASVEGELRELWAGRTKGWVDDADLAEVNRLLKRLAALLLKPRSASRSRLLSLAFVLAPVRARPVRRSLAGRRARRR